MILNPESKQGLIVNPGTNKKVELLNIKSSGVFVALRLTKQGGSNDLTAFDLKIDGKSVAGLTFAAARNFGLDRPNNSGTMLSNGIVDCITVQFNEPLSFKRSLVLSISTGTDAGVVQIIGVVVVGSNCSYP